MRCATSHRSPSTDRRLKPFVRASPSIVRVLAAFAIASLPSCAPDPAPAPAAPARYVGSGSCAPCHEKEATLWRDSQHAVAMQDATPETVLGDFDDATFTHAGVTSRFFRRDGRFMVATDGPDGEIGEFEVRHTFGVTPLQQYLVAMPQGRLQALGVAWDSRAADAGGQRWFHLYPERRLEPGDPLHWTGIDQTWNYQCADCHSTDLRKNYDAATGTYATTWSEISVGCEACHGPGSDHVAWAATPSDRRSDPRKGLVVLLDERRGVTWTIPPNRPTALRSRHRETEREIDACARCHARRGQLTDAFAAGQPFHDGFRPALVESGLYHPDGRQMEEVYTWGSFLQSKMHRQGVTCSDCHEPHGGRPRADGNALCAQCHEPAAFDTPEHHHHPAGSAGAACVGCHMPTTTYMVVDPRHDHAFSVPDPDRSAATGSPDACAACHADRSAKWLGDAVRSWRPAGRDAPRTFASAFLAGGQGAPGAQQKLGAVAADAEWPPIVRASALARLARFASPSVVATAAESLEDRNPDVRAAAVAVIAEADMEARLRLLPGRLADPSRLVRMDAARALAPAEAELRPADRPAFDRALAEWIAAQRFNADRPEAAASMGTLAVEQGNAAEAEAAFRRAFALDSTFVQAAVNLADLYRLLGRERDAERVLREALDRNPACGPVLHALGLGLIRQKRTREGMEFLGEAARREPGVARFAFVHGVALHDAGERQRAVEVLEAALRLHPYDRDLLFTLAGYDREAGRADRAGAREALLRVLEPEAFSGR